MSLHENILTDICGLIDSYAGVDILSPTFIAREMQGAWSEEAPEPRLAYTSLEHLKQLARRVLSGRYDADSDAGEVQQGELFSGQLQTRYPIPRKRGDDPGYKLLGALDDSEVRWNIETLRKSGIARLDHARALEAWREDRARAA